MRVKGKIEIIDQENGAIVFDKSRGIYFQVNECGSLVVKSIKENKSRNEIVDLVVQKFGIDKTLAENHTDDFLEMLQKEGLTK